MTQQPQTGEASYLFSGDSPRYLGIDFGDKNIGIAISDPTGIIATPLTTIVRANAATIKPYVAQIGQMIKEHHITAIVLGLPKNMDNTQSERAAITIDFKERLERNFKRTPVILWDERLTSVGAERFFREQNIKAKDQKKLIDELAACIILQNYLDYQANNAK